MTKETISVLNDARHEIVRLRRANELLEARMSVFDQMMCLLHTRPAERNEGASIDVAWQLEQLVAQEEALKVRTMSAVPLPEQTEAS